MRGAPRLGVGQRRPRFRKCKPSRHATKPWRTTTQGDSAAGAVPAWADDSDIAFDRGRAADLGVDEEARAAERRGRRAVRQARLAIVADGRGAGRRWQSGRRPLGLSACERAAEVWPTRGPSRDRGCAGGHVGALMATIRPRLVRRARTGGGATAWRAVRAASSVAAHPCRRLARPGGGELRRPQR